MWQAERDDSDDRRIHDENIGVGTSPGDINNACTCHICEYVKVVFNPFKRHVFWTMVSFNSA